MSVTRDPDRILRAWLDLMPDAAPEHVFDAVLEAVDATPQRRPFFAGPWRLTPMTRLALAGGLAAIIVAAGLFFIGRPPDSSRVAATPSLAPSPSPSPAGAATLPVELRGRWMGDHRPIVAADAGTTVLFDATSLAVSQANTGTSVLLRSTASASGPARIRLESGTTTGGCTAGDVGTYGWTTSPSGRSLTIAAEADDCSVRAETVAGSWSLMGCANPDNYCLGPLDAGTHKSQFIAPRLDPGGSWTANFGALSYAVSDGWANSDDWPERFDLVPAAEMPPISEANRTRQIGLVTQPTAMAQDKPCSDEAAPGVGRSVDALATWLRTVPGLVSSKPVAVAIDGHQGKWLDLRLDSGWKQACPPDEPRPIIAFLNPGVAISNVERERLILVDLGGGDVIGVVVWAHDQATFDAFLPEAMTMIQSFQFE